MPHALAETITSPTESGAAAAIRADALRAEAWAGEPFLRAEDDPEVVLAPGTARRRALDDALAEIDAGPEGAVLGLEGALRAPARPRTRPLGEAASPRLRHRAAPPPGRRARRHAHRADRRGRRRPRTRTGTATATSRRPKRTTSSRTSWSSQPELDDEEIEPEPLPVAQDPGAIRRYRFRHPTASGKTIAASGFVEAARTEGVLILTHRRLLVDQFRRELTDHGYGARFHDAILEGHTAPRDLEPDHDPDVRLVRAPRQRDRTRRIPARDLRRGAHRARREDLDRDPLAERADLHRHDRDGGADREAGLRRLPRLRRRPAADRRSAPRADRPAALPARAAGRGDQPGSDRRRRLRGARAGAGSRPRGPEHGGSDALPRALRRHAGHRLRGRRRPRLQPRDGVPRRRRQGGGRLRPHAAREAGRDPRGVRARRDRRARERDAARRGLELAARDDRHAPRADRLEARLPAADRAHHAHPPAQGGGHRRRLHAEGGDPQRARRLAALAARRRLLPRRRARHPRAAPPHAAPRTPQADAGVVARARHARRSAPQDGDRARVAARRPEVPRRRRAGVLGRDRRTPAALRGARGLRREADRARRLEARDGEVPLHLRGRRTRTGACG